MVNVQPPAIEANRHLTSTEIVAAAARCVYPEFAKLGEQTTNQITAYIRAQFIQIDQEIAT